MLLVYKKDDGNLSSTQNPTDSDFDHIFLNFLKGTEIFPKESPRREARKLDFLN